MTDRPLNDPTRWATDATITDPLHPEFGLSTRIAVPGGDQAQGARGNGRIGARKFNGLMGNATDWIAYLAEKMDAMRARNWRKENEDFTPTLSYVLHGAIWVPGTTSTLFEGGRWYLYGHTGAGSGAVVVLPRLDATVDVFTTLLENVQTMACNGDGSVLLAAGTESTGTNTVVNRSTNRGASWTAFNVDTTANVPIHFLRYDPAEDVFVATRFAAYNSTDFIWTSADGGQTWTDRSGVFPVWSSGVPQVVEASDNTILVAGTKNTICYSHDGGLTWGQTAALPGSVSNVFGLAYSHTRGFWRALGFDGANCRILKSLDDGASWSLEATLSEITSSGQLAYQTNCIYCDDDGLWMIPFTSEAGAGAVSNNHGVIHFGDNVASRQFALVHSDSASIGFEPKFMARGPSMHACDHFGLYGESDSNNVWYTSLRG